MLMLEAFITWLFTEHSGHQNSVCKGPVVERQSVAHQRDRRMALRMLKEKI